MCRGMGVSDYSGGLAEIAMCIFCTLQVGAAEAEWLDGCQRIAVARSGHAAELRRCWPLEGRRGDSGL